MPMNRTTSTTFILVPLLFGALHGVPAGEPEAVEMSKATVEQLIEKLRGEDFGERQHAVKALISRGESIRSKIEAALQKSSTDLDFSMQLKRVLDGLSAAKVLGRFERPKRIDLSLKDVPAREVG